MKRISAKHAYANYIENKPVTTINTSKLTFQQRIYLEAKQQWRELETARAEMVNAKLNK